MKIKNFLTIVIFILLISFSSQSFSQSNNKIEYTKKETRNVWGLGFNYAENGFGPSVSLFAPIGKATDLSFNLIFSGVTDAREIERFDVFGNSITYDKINRVFMIPLSIGIKQQLFKDDIEGDFIPLVNFGISPTLILTNPYNESFFNALGYTKTHFGFGGYGGIGVYFKQSESISMSVNLNYYYIPIFGEAVQSLQYSTIDNVGGFQLGFGINFMK
ncbi:MAG: hypothetical protein M3R36_17350 [Bacteroidota bacterium]|nr:hypothetical protein [Bacteroidota bacterium]